MYNDTAGDIFETFLPTCIHPCKSQLEEYGLVTLNTRAKAVVVSIYLESPSPPNTLNRSMLSILNTS